MDGVAHISAKWVSSGIRSERMCDFIEKSVKNIHRDVTIEDWEILREAAAKSTRGIAVTPELKGRLETLFIKQQVTFMEEKIDDPIKNMSNEKYGISDSFIETVARYNANEDPTEQIARLSGFAFENLFTRLISEKEPWNTRCIAFAICDIDVVRTQVQNGFYKVSLYTLKLSESEMQESLKKFCELNVKKFLDKKIDSHKVTHVDLFAVTAESQYQNKDGISEDFQAGVESLTSEFPDIKFTITVTTFDEYISSLPECSLPKTTTGWPYVPRTRFENDLYRNLEGGKISTLIRGYAGVGKTMSVRRVVDNISREMKKKVFWISLGELKIK